MLDLREIGLGDAEYILGEAGLTHVAMCPDGEEEGADVLSPLLMVIEQLRESLRVLGHPSCHISQAMIARKLCLSSRLVQIFEMPG